ncbi:hypothetical protein SLEP1_g59151 [Rubroshorea leprosula]|uniref:Uncharacterized protein n=1 Tax=Rubroshorea leprosula TaxID=152421 RepID=A0AAV5MTZ1_9ROSI|nr:hypothetical protein SLEP1_g59151 [Rubroshorea leprosula]
MTRCKMAFESALLSFMLTLFDLISNQMERSPGLDQIIEDGLLNTLSLCSSGPSSREKDQEGQTLSKTCVSSKLFHSVFASRFGIEGPTETEFLRYYVLDPGVVFVFAANDSAAISLSLTHEGTMGLAIGSKASGAQLAHYDNEQERLRYECSLYDKNIRRGRDVLNGKAPGDIAGDAHKPAKKFRKKNTPIYTSIPPTDPAKARNQRGETCTGNATTQVLRRVSKSLMSVAASQVPSAWS